MSDRGRASEHRATHRRADDDRAGEHEQPGPAALLALQQGAGNRAVAALVVQRHAFVRDKQVKPSSPNLTPTMKAMAADTTVRDYRDGGEFADHADGKTDHLGTLRAGSPGTWVRFARTGSNLLGEDHTKVKLEHVMPAVGSTSFIYEPLATDDLSASPAMKAAYEQENAIAEQVLAGDTVDGREPVGETEFLARPCTEYRFALTGQDDGHPYRSDVRLLVWHGLVLFREVRDATVSDLRATAEVTELDA
jgi:hypothetical protein